MKTNTLNTSFSKRKTQLLQNRVLRNKYIADQIKIGLRNQLRSLRDDRNLTQGQLAEMIGTKQSVISRMEREPLKVGMGTYLDIARQLDVAFVVRFEAIDTFGEWYENPSQRKMTPPPSEKLLRELAEQLSTSANIQLSVADGVASVDPNLLTKDGTSYEPLTESEATWIPNADVIDEPLITSFSVAKQPPVATV